MANKWELHCQFKSFGINVQEDILNCAVDMCGRLFIDERELVETWLAYSLTNLDGAKPTIELLLQMEQKEFSDKSLNTPKRMTGDLAVYDFQSCIKRKKDTPSLSDDEIQSPPKKASISESSSHVNKPQSPLPVTPSSYSKRVNAGKIQTDYGLSICNWESKEIPVKIALYNSNPDWKSMNTSLLEENKILADCGKQVAQVIAERNKINLTDQLDSKNEGETEESDNHEEAYYAGRILTSDNAKLTLGSVVLDNFEGGTLDVDMGGVINYSLFPGQVVICKGPKRGKKVIALDLFTSACLPQLGYSPKEKEPVQIIVAAGPFTQNDALTYEPLEDLIKHVKEQKPHAFILIGPLVDANHSLIKNGSMNETFSQFLSKILTEIEDSLKGTGTQFFVVTSSSDSFTNPIYPTQPPTLEKWSEHLLPDPCLLDVNGFILGVTSTDVLMHLGRKEISNCGDRLARLAGHIIHQQSFYPLYPPDSEVGLDLSLWENHARLPVTPHALVVPSDLHCFIKETEGVITINPGKLSKGVNGGNYACIEVQASDSDKWSPSTHVASKLVKI